MMPDVTLNPKDLERLREVAQDIFDSSTLLIAAQQRRDKAIHKAAKNGATVREIAEVTGISHQRVHQILSAPSERKQGSD